MMWSPLQWRIWTQILYGDQVCCFSPFYLHSGLWHCSMEAPCNPPEQHLLCVTALELNIEFNHFRRSATPAYTGPSQVTKAQFYVQPTDTNKRFGDRWDGFTGCCGAAGIFGRLGFNWSLLLYNFVRCTFCFTQQSPLLSFTQHHCLSLKLLLIFPFISSIFPPFFVT